MGTVDEGFSRYKASRWLQRIGRRSLTTCFDAQSDVSGCSVRSEKGPDITDQSLILSVCVCVCVTRCDPYLSIRILRNFV